MPVFYLTYFHLFDLLNPLTTWFPCALYASCRTYNTSLFPSCPDEASCPLSDCNYAVYNPDMRVLSLRAQLSPPFSSTLALLRFKHDKKSAKNASVRITYKILFVKHYLIALKIFVLRFRILLCKQCNLFL